MTDTQGEPIIGATVLVKGTGIGTATDIDWQVLSGYSIHWKTLVVSFIGFDAQEIPVTNNATYKIQLSGTDYALDEVVVTALGMKREKKALGYSVQDVKGDALIENRTANIATSLEW
ncbi:MAG: carboxypeptidase-like regulatory domain-containing protein [Bacteroides cellulosilyticus]